MPVSVMPEKNTQRVSPESYGDYPERYQTILKDYLQNNLLNHEDAKVEFINKPAKISIRQMGKIYNGHRLCLSINSRNSKSIYSGYKTHLFLINDSKVELHLYDSGLLRIPFELCVDTNEANSIYLKEIPDDVEEILLDEMDTIDLNSDLETKEIDQGNIYISCKINNNERTFFFNDSKNILIESVGIDEIALSDIKFSTTHILGYKNEEEILINRVSGSISIAQDIDTIMNGSCILLDKKKF